MIIVLRINIRARLELTSDLNLLNIKTKMLNYKFGIQLANNAIKILMIIYTKILKGIIYTLIYYLELY